MNKKTLLILLAIVFFAGLIFLASKNSNLMEENSGKTRVITSFYPLYFFTSEIGGERADVVNLTPSSAEPHDYDPTAQDIAKISNANLLVINGNGLEVWGDKIKDQLKGTDVLVIEAGEGLATKQITEEGKTIKDPHIWLDPTLAKKEVENIEKALEKADPKDKEYFKSNAEKLEKKLDELDQEFRDGLRSCIKKDFVTSHEAFGYLAQRYGLNQVAISGISPDEEPSSKKIAEIADLVRKQDIKIIFFESLISPKLSETIARETGAKTLVLDPIEGISDKDLNQGRNYFTVMRENLNSLQTALECTK